MANYIIQLKRGKSSSWTTLNPVLSPGEPGFEIDTGKVKIGNGIDEWVELPYLGQDKTLIVNAETHYDFPAIGDANIIYKALQEKQFYQWNENTYEYEVIIRNDWITIEQLQEAIDKIEIPEISLEEYATKAYAQELFNNVVPLTTEELHELCK